MTHTHCPSCRGQSHHWIEAPPIKPDSGAESAPAILPRLDGSPYPDSYICLHCDVLGYACPRCDGGGYDDKGVICTRCEGVGVVEED